MTPRTWCCGGCIAFDEGNICNESRVVQCVVRDEGDGSISTIDDVRTRQPISPEKFITWIVMKFVTVASIGKL